MANMSYCRFENTSIDLRDCVNALEEGDYPGSDDEKQAAKYMIALCERYVQAYESMELELNDD
jgi:hypothetical protein